MEKTENGCLKLWLSQDDMARYALSFEQLHEQDSATQAALRQWLLQAEQTCAFTPRGTLIIEALPLEGGCLLLITPQKKRVRLRRAGGPYVYEVENSDRLLQLGGSLKNLASHRAVRYRGSSSLYRYGRGYHLVLYPLYPLSTSLRRVLDTLAVRRGEGDAAAAFSAEHGHPVSVGDAWERLTENG